jgi:hypothetical protein
VHPQDTQDEGHDKIDDIVSSFQKHSNQISKLLFLVSNPFLPSGKVGWATSRPIPSNIYRNRSFWALVLFCILVKAVESDQKSSIRYSFKNTFQGPFVDHKT